MLIVPLAPKKLLGSILHLMKVNVVASASMKVCRAHSLLAHLHRTDLIERSYVPLSKIRKMYALAVHRIFLEVVTLMRKTKCTL